MSGTMREKRTSDAPEVELTRPPSDQWARPINYRDGDGSRAADPGSDNSATGADSERARGRSGLRTRRSTGSRGFGIRSRSGSGSGSRAEGRDGYVVALNRAMAEYPDDLRELVEDYLKQLHFSSIDPTSGLDEAMRYSLLAGGKRIRPVLALATARSIGLDPQRVLPAAAALELVHTYSLIHDDLPAMDDDELRRGMPTSHVKFGENVAILAGDALFAEAMRLFSDRQEGDPAAVLAALRELITAAGVGGMVGGQYIDVTEFDAAAKGDWNAAANLNASRLREMHALKTGRLIGASVGVVLVLGQVPEDETIPYRRFADELGVLFQIVDDILDVTGSDEELGKPSGSDERHGKLTYVSAHGLEQARELASESHRKAREALAQTQAQTDDLARITDFIHTRHT
jgi:geranylgeranyl diphosphate synthase, type II